MTQDELRRQKVDLTIQVEDAEKLLAGLREKANALSDKLRFISNWLRNNPQGQIHEPGMVNDNGIPFSDSYASALEIGPMLKLVDQIREQMRVVSDLKGRLARLA
jgi:hypothetical protein